MHTEQELNRCLVKYTKMQSLFLVFGIIAIVVGGVGSFVLGFVYGYNNPGDVSGIFKIMSELPYSVFYHIANMLITGGIVLLILRGTLCNAKIRHFVAELNALRAKEVQPEEPKAIEEPKE